MLWSWHAQGGRETTRHGNERGHWGWIQAPEATRVAEVTSPCSLAPHSGRVLCVGCSTGGSQAHEPFVRQLLLQGQLLSCSSVQAVPMAVDPMLTHISIEIFLAKECVVPARGLLWKRVERQAIKHRHFGLRYGSHCGHCPYLSCPVIAVLT